MICPYLEAVTGIYSNTASHDRFLRILMFLSLNPHEPVGLASNSVFFRKSQDFKGVHNRIPSDIMIRDEEITILRDSEERPRLPRWRDMASTARHRKEKPVIRGWRRNTLTDLRPSQHWRWLLVTWTHLHITVLYHCRKQVQYLSSA